MSECNHATNLNASRNWKCWVILYIVSANVIKPWILSHLPIMRPKYSFRTTLELHYEILNTFCLNCKIYNNILSNQFIFQNYSDLNGAALITLHTSTSKYWNSYHLQTCHTLKHFQRWEVEHIWVILFADNTYIKSSMCEQILYLNSGSIPNYTKLTNWTTNWRWTTARKVYSAYHKCTDKTFEWMKPNYRRGNHINHRWYPKEIKFDYH